MANYVKPSAVEKSQLVRGILTFQWFYALCGIALPPLLLRRNAEGRLQKVVSALTWLFYVLHVLLLNYVVMWMVWDNNLIVDIVVQRYVLDGVTKILSIVQNYDVVCVQLAMALATFFGRKTLMQIHETIAQLEQDIVGYQKSLEDKSDLFKRRCSSFRRRLFLRCGIFFVLHTVLQCYAKFPMIWDNLSGRDKFLTLFSFHLMHSKCSEYRVMMSVLNELISALQDSLINLKYEIARHDLLGNCVGAGESTLYRKLRSHQFLLSRFWSLVQLIEAYFSLPMLILFLYNGINITHTINWIYVKSFRRNEKDRKHPYRFAYIILLFLNMLWTCWLSQMCIDKYHHIVNILHSIRIKANDLALVQRLREYSLQLKHQEIKFTCWGFFDMNMKYFGLLSLTILTYVFILLQFKLQAETEKAIRL
ncbi:putative gustatory receptor 98b [Musca vetustissima]|uniref:putative gustatory receptor 98b n=1 Tax=Musca vetustissima TaxID=27455 RepID=UPI002AB77D57|nr:putative gustatory receptor 98b [Musca vetustissima]